MSISDKLTYLNATKTAIKQAIQNKGITVSDADTFRSYADKIGQIEAGGGGSVVEPEENFDIYRAYDVDIDENRIASNFSQYAWIDGKTQDTSAKVVNVITKLKLTNVITLQSSLFATIYVKNSRFGVWETGTSSEKLGSVTIKTNTWYWVQCVFYVSNGTYNHYVLEDNEQKYTLSTLPDVSEWLLNIENGTRNAPTMEIISIGNNSQEWNEQYIRGSFDLNGTKIICEDGTVWTPYSKKSTQTVSGDTTWVYYTGQAVAGDKVMLTKVNSLVTPDDAFCNGFKVDLILNGYAYGRVGDSTSIGEYAQRRQIVNGVVDSSTAETLPSNNLGTYNYCVHYGLNGACSLLIHLTNSSFALGGSSTIARLVEDTSVSIVSGGGRMFLLENFSVGMTSSSSSSGIPIVYDYATKSSFNLGSSKNLTNLAWEDGTPDCFYTFTGDTWTSGMIFRRNTISTKTSEDMTPIPNVVITGTNQAKTIGVVFLQTKDYKYLLHEGGYVDVTLKDNTITINDYPPVIVNAIGDRAVRQMQVFYDGYFCFQLEDGVTLMCKYDNDMSDVRIDETVEPIYVEGDDKVYIRSYSADRLYWWQLSAYRNSTYEVMSLANNPAGPYKAKEASSDYVAYTPSKDRFNSTVLTGFLTGEIKEEDGRLMVEVRTTGIDLSRKQDRFLVEELLSETTLKNNTIFRADETESVELLLPETFEYDFLCEVDFTSGETPTEFTMVDSINWTGDDIEDDSFVPSSNKRYNLLFWYDGLDLKGIVKGFE